MTYITAVTLQTDTRTRVYRDNVLDQDVDQSIDWIKAALSGGTPIIGANISMTATREGRNLVVTLWDKTGAALITVAVCLKSRAGPGVWRMLHETATPPIDLVPFTHPPAPWAVTRIEPTDGLVKNAGILDWTGQFADALAWAWMEMCNDKSD